MNKDKKIIIGLFFIILVLVIGGLAFYAGKNSREESKLPVRENNLPQENQLVNTPVQNNTVVNTNVQPSTILPQYIGGQNWPPVIKTSTVAYSCVSGVVGMGGRTVTTEKIINGKTYCVAYTEEGAMGKIYKTYTYTTALGSGTKATMPFTLSYQECGVYRDNSVSGGAIYNQCNTNELNFNIDAVMTGLM